MRIPSAFPTSAPRGSFSGNAVRPDAIIRVYTRPVDPDSYPEGLARSVHFSCDPDGSGFQPLNRNLYLIHI